MFSLILSCESSKCVCFRQIIKHVFRIACNYCYHLSFHTKDSSFDMVHISSLCVFNVLVLAYCFIVL